MNILDSINGFKSGSIYATPASSPCALIRAAVAQAVGMIASFTGQVDKQQDGSYILTVTNLTSGALVVGQALYGTGLYTTTKTVQPIPPATLPTITTETVNDYPAVTDGVLIVSQLTSAEPFILDASGNPTTNRTMGKTGTYSISGWAGYPYLNNASGTTGAQLIPGPMQTVIPPTTTNAILAAINDGTNPVTTGWETELNAYIRSTSNYMPFINAANNVSSKIGTLSGTPQDPTKGSTDLQTISGPVDVVPAQLGNINVALNKYLAGIADANSVLPVFNTANTSINNSFSAATAAKSNVISTITTFASASFSLAKQTPAVQGFMNKMLKL
jgi:hypothetical protein